MPDLVFFLFFVSGFAALMYQIIWQRALFAIYGTNFQSITVIVSAFMLGLGLGSVCGGYVSQLNVPLVAAFGFAELGTAVFGFCSLRLFNLVAVHTAGTNTLTTGLIAFLLLLIPTILMGSTLPILIMYFVRVIPTWADGRVALFRQYAGVSDRLFDSSNFCHEVSWRKRLCCIGGWYKHTSRHHCAGLLLLFPC